MKDFVSEIKKINTDGLIYKFSEIFIGKVQQGAAQLEMECKCAASR